MKNQLPTYIFPLHDTVFDGTTHALAGLLFVTVVASTVNETVANLKGAVNHLQTHIDEQPKWKETVGLTSAQLSLGIWNKY